MTRQEYIELVKQVWPNVEVVTEYDVFDDFFKYKFCFSNIGNYSSISKPDLDKLKISAFTFDFENNFISFFTEHQITE